MTLALGAWSAEALAVDTSAAYWTTSNTACPDAGADGGPDFCEPVMKVSLDGGGLTTLLPKTSGAFGLAVDPTSIYLTFPPDGTVVSLPVGGGPTTVLANGQTWPLGIVATDIALYWASQGTPNNLFEDGTISVVALDGGPPTTLLVTQNPCGIAVDTTSAYWTDYGLPDPTNADGGIVRAALDGGGPTTLTWGQPSVSCSVAVDSTNVYWINEGTQANNYADGAVLRIPRGGGAVTTIATSQVNAGGLAIDGTSVYWTSLGTGAKQFSDGAVFKAPLGGGPVTPLVTGESGPGAIAVDATSVYWTGGNAVVGAVRKLTPK